jgi:hypothetical protein
VKSTHIISRLTVIILVVAILLTGCVNRDTTSSVTVSYSPPLLPIEITYDVISGQLKVALSGRIQTPIGDFKVSFGAASIAKRYNGVRTLTLITGNRKYVYELEHGRPYSIKLPSDENGQTEVRYTGNDDNLEISIPNPTDETIAQLKEKLKEEQESHGGGSGVATDTPESETPGAEAQPLLTPSPTPQTQRVLTLKECQELVAQYVPGQFIYIPSECQDMFRAYQAYLQQQEYESGRKQEQEDYEARRKQQQDDYERARQEEWRRRNEEAAARRREEKIQQWTNVIEEILRRRRRRF